MVRTMRITGILLLAAFVLSIFTAQSSEASPTQDKVQKLINKFEKQLCKIVGGTDTFGNTWKGKAVQDQQRKLNKVANLVAKYNNNQISRNKFCKKINGIKTQEKALDKQINKKKKKIIKKMKKLNGSPLHPDVATGIADAKKMAQVAHDKKHDLYDDLDDAIAAAKKVPSPWCT